MAEGSRRSVVLAAGGVVWRDGAGGVEVALVHRPRYDDWSLPKGKLEQGEPAVVGACREVLEETGLRVAAGRTLGESRYRVVADGREVPKTVRWWSMRALDGEFRATDEVDELRWTSPDKAMRMLTAGRDTEPLRLFLSGPPATRTLLLVRHASAGDRKRFSGDDDLRPLDGTGVRQARALARVLVAYAPGRLVSAPIVRCSDTLRPLAGSTGLQVDLDPLLAARAYSAEPRRTVERLRELVRDGVTVVACSQGEVLPEVVQVLGLGGTAALDGPLQAAKGSLWALSFDDDGCLVDADHLPDPTG